MLVSVGSTTKRQHADRFPFAPVLFKKSAVGWLPRRDFPKGRMSRWDGWIQIPSLLWTCVRQAVRSLCDFRDPSNSHRTHEPGLGVLGLEVQLLWQRDSVSGHRESRGGTNGDGGVG